MRPMTHFLSPVIICAICVLTVLQSHGAAQAESRVSVLRLGVDQAESCETEYDAPSFDADCAYYLGGRLPLEASLYNSSDREVILTLSRPLMSLISFSIVGEGIDATGAHVRLESRAQMESGDGTVAVDPAVTTVIFPPHGLLLFSGEVVGLSTPGQYTVEGLCDVVDSDGRPVDPASNIFYIELRAPIGNGALEARRREALRALNAGDYDRADRLADALLALHPFSYAAFWVKGASADRQGRVSEALAMFRRAQELLLSDGALHPIAANRTVRQDAIQESIDRLSDDVR